MNKLYTRAIIDVNEDDESRVITGKAVTFDTPSQYIGYVEYIRSSAITQELIDSSDIIMNFQHDDTRMLARWTRGKGTLSVSLREDGVYFEFEAPDTTLGNDILWHVRHGNLTKCSFAFTIPENGMRWFRNEDNELCGEVVEIDGLYDLSIVTTPAYEDTFVDARDFDLEAIKRSLDESQEIVSEEVKEVIEQEVNAQVEQRNDETNKNESFYTNEVGTETSKSRSFYIKYNDRLKNILNKI